MTWNLQTQRCSSIAVSDARIVHDRDIPGRVGFDSAELTKD